MNAGAGMRAEELKPCAICGKGMAHAGVPLFYRVRLEHMGINANAVRRTDAMERFFGGSAANPAGIAVARVFEDPVIAEPIVDATEVLVCQPCALEPRPLLMLAERDG